MADLRYGEAEGGGRLAWIVQLARVQLTSRHLLVAVPHQLRYAAARAREPLIPRSRFFSIGNNEPAVLPVGLTRPEADF